MTPEEHDIATTAEDDLGIEELRPGQRRAAAASVEGRDVLAVMPSGYGKSAIYQLAAAEIPGPTLVISPLIALQRDQVMGLDSADVGDAVEINSSLTAGQRDGATARVQAGEVEFVFLAPEQLVREDTLEMVRAAAPSLVVVDEAHCISAWGHDFRPDYLRIGEVIDALGHPRVMALTATAAPPVQREIIERLGMRDPLVLVRGLDRPNIRLEVAHMPEADTGAKDEALLRRVTELAKGGRSGIVYVATRARTEELAEQLAARDVAAESYHAGLPSRRRDEVHERWFSGRTPVVVATTAFGMGVDKADVRFVVHGDVADSLDSYAQEFGRAGRDGGSADAVLFYRPEDLGLRRFLGAGGAVDPDEVAAVAGATSGSDRRDVSALAEELDMPRRRLERVLTRLADTGWVRLEGTDVVAVADVDAERAAADVAGRDETRAQLEASRLEMMRGYAETTTCRRRFLLTYFAEEHRGDCGNCDNCESGRAAATRDVDGQADAFPVGSRVRHREWGEGEVIRVEATSLAVLFDQGGYRTLATDVVVDKGLLELC